MKLNCERVWRRGNYSMRGTVVESDPPRLASLIKWDTETEPRWERDETLEPLPIHELYLEERRFDPPPQQGREAAK